jgi:hypothetical protein
MLLYKWRQITPLAATERLYFEAIKYCRKNNIPIPSPPEIIKLEPLSHLNIIKKRIIEIEPKLQCIYEDYNPQMDLISEDFEQLYISHQMIKISKIKKFFRDQGKKVND